VKPSALDSLADKRFLIGGEMNVHMPQITGKWAFEQGKKWAGASGCEFYIVTSPAM
jgi:hypothetical protein